MGINGLNHCIKNFILKSINLHSRKELVIKLKAAILINKNEIKVADLHMPIPGDNQILVRNKFCLICNSTDTKFYTGKYSRIKYPCIIGHESVGIVESIGKNIDEVHEGDFVLGGSYPESSKIASFWGQFSEYGIVDKEEIVQIPSGVKLETAALSHMLSEALNAAIVSDLKPGDNIIIIGSGAVGSSLITITKHFFPANIIVIDLIQEKLDFATKLGADAVFNAKDFNISKKIKEITGGKPTDIIFEATGLQNAYDMAINIADYGTKILAFGIIEEKFSVAFRNAYDKELQIRWCTSVGKGGNDNKKNVLNMMKKNLINTDLLITSQFSLNDLKMAFNKIVQGKEIRVMISI